MWACKVENCRFCKNLALNLPYVSHVCIDLESKTHFQARVIVESNLLFFATYVYNP